jgi:SAM-dependent methyltransferase
VLLAGLAGDMRITGIDLSPEMLAIAARNVPAAHLVETDMTEFWLGEQFDVVICVFDTINHLTHFDLWVELFRRVHEHLTADGLFVFDVNTIGRLRMLRGSPAFVQDFGENVMIMDVRAGPGDHVSIWDARIFERFGADLFRLHREQIFELAVSLPRIREALQKDFELLEEASVGDGPVTDESARVFFACRKRSQSVA